MHGPKEGGALWTALRGSRLRQKPLVSLAQTIGTNFEAYQCALSIIRGQYKVTGDVRYCNLRLDLLMSVHDDFKSRALFAKDTCHSLASVLERCRGESKVSPQNLQVIVAILDQVPTKHPVLGDIGMILSHVHFSRILINDTLSALVSLTQSLALPRNDTRLSSLARVIGISLAAHSMLIDTQFDPRLPTRDETNQLFTVLAEVVATSQLLKEPTAPLADVIARLCRSRPRVAPLAGELVVGLITRMAAAGNLDPIEHLLPLSVAADVSARARDSLVEVAETVLSSGAGSRAARHAFSEWKRATNVRISIPRAAGAGVARGSDNPSAGVDKGTS